MRRERGFTLVEVMLGLALLALALIVVLRSATSSMFGARSSHMTGIATDLARGKMYDIEEKLLKEGFTETDQSEEGDFEAEGWESIKWKAEVQEVELPSYEELQALTTNRAKTAGSGSGGSGSGSGSEGEYTKSFQDSALGGMLMGGLLGGGGGDIESAQGGALIQGQYKLFQDILKVSLRKVTLVVSYEVMGRDLSIKTVAYFTQSGEMDKVLAGMGQSDLDDAGGGTGSGGTGSGGTGSGGTGGTRTPRAGSGSGAR